jgi:hypothetical protein
MGFNARIVASIIGALSGAPDVGSVRYNFEQEAKVDLALGTGLRQANHVFTDERVLAASASETLDLAGGLTDALGATLTFTAIKAILIQADDANVNNVVVGGGSNPFRGWFADATDKLSIPPGGFILLTDPTAAGQTVTAATGDLLLVANSGSGTGVTYTITIIGEA